MCCVCYCLIKYAVLEVGSNDNAEDNNVLGKYFRLGPNINCNRNRKQKNAVLLDISCILAAAVPMLFFPHMSM